VFVACNLLKWYAGHNPVQLSAANLVLNAYTHTHAGLIDVLPSLLAFDPQRFGLPPFEDTVEGTIPMVVRVCVRARVCLYVYFRCHTHGGTCMLGTVVVSYYC
jgi:hypothetical protein